MNSDLFSGGLFRHPRSRDVQKKTNTGIFRIHANLGQEVTMCTRQKLQCYERLQFVRRRNSESIDINFDESSIHEDEVSEILSTCFSLYSLNASFSCLSS